MGLNIEEALKKDEEKRLKEYRKFMDQLYEQGFWHYCEVCGKKEHLNPIKAFEEGWIYPPKMGRFGVLSPRKCRACKVEETLWWKFTFGRKKDLTEQEKKTMERIFSEPYSLQE